MSDKFTKREIAWLKRQLLWRVNWNHTRILDRPKAELLGVKIGKVEYETRIMRSIIAKLDKLL